MKFTIKAVLILFVLICINAQASDHLDTKHTKAQVPALTYTVQALTYTVSTSHHLLFDQVRTIMDDLGRAIANLWRTILGQPLDQGGDPQLPAESVEQQLYDVQRNLRKLQHATTERIEDPLWASATDLERGMLREINKNSTQALALDGAAGVGGAGTAAWFYSLDPVGTIRKLNDIKFFSGLEIGAAVGILKPLLTPLVVLVVGAVVYTKVKDFMVYEYRDQAKAQVSELQALVQRYHDEAEKRSESDKKAMAGALQKHVAKMEQGISQVRQHFVQLQGEMDQNQKSISGIIQKVQNDFAAQIAAVRKENATLETELKKDDAEQKKKIEAQRLQLVHHEQKLGEAQQHLLQYHHELERQRKITEEHFKGQGDNLSKLGEQMHGVGDINKQLKDKLDLQALPALKKLVDDVAKLRQHTEKELGIVRWVETTVVPYMQHKAKNSTSIAAALPPPPGYAPARR